ncbi:MAG TPA: hypothetical protein VLE47_02705 [Candidatus Saccharimonadales bacterium]|nr:hypothetical protein [Candidatus Saccharimonadales bacterium]
MGWLANLFKGPNYVAEGHLTLLDRQTASDRWKGVEEQASLGKPSNYRSAVIDADKILEFVLSKMYPSLNSTGERLKRAKDKFVGNYEIYDGLWFAHKTRNELVHNVNFELYTATATEVLEKFKAGLVHLGAL